MGSILVDVVCTSAIPNMTSLQTPQTPCLTHFWCTASCCVAQIKDAVRDGLRAVKNVIDDKAVVLGAGAFEVAAAQHLRESVKKQVGSKDCHAYPVLESLANIASIDGCMLAVCQCLVGYSLAQLYAGACASTALQVSCQFCQFHQALLHCYRVVWCCRRKAGPSWVWRHLQRPCWAL
jgi:hypothetical protein